MSLLLIFIFCCVQGMCGGIEEIDYECQSEREGPRVLRPVFEGRNWEFNQWRNYAAQGKEKLAFAEKAKK